MTTRTLSIEVLATPSEVYRRCTDVATLAGLSAVDAVSTTPEGLTRWRVRLGAMRRSCVAEATERSATRLSWRSIDDELEHDGSFAVERTERSTTLLVCEWRWKPHGLEEIAAAAVGADEHAVQRSLEELKADLEQDIA